MAGGCGDGVGWAVWIRVVCHVLDKGRGCFFANSRGCQPVTEASESAHTHATPRSAHSRARMRK